MKDAATAGIFTTGEMGGKRIRSPRQQLRAALGKWRFAVGSTCRYDGLDECSGDNIGRNLGRWLKLAVENESAPSKLRRADRRLVIHGINKRDAEHPSTDGPPRRVLGAAADRADRFDQRTSELR